jgi:NAD(P)-dependent dehydrogenase (short-subunit alcohol dehydrogenase family)
MIIGSNVAAVVTGGASGLGEATARALAARGAKVALFDLNAVRGERVAQEIGGLFCAVDVASEQSVEDGLARARSINGQERIAVNCAGIVIAQKTAAKDREHGFYRPHELDAFVRVITTNLVGTFNVMSKSAAGMATLQPVSPDGSRGVIVNASSIAAIEGQIGQIAYAASKGGIQAMTLPAARDLSREGIRVCAIQPGLFHTSMFDALDEDVRKSLAAGVPFPTRLGRPDEFAALVCHVVENDMLNGALIRLDGGLRLPPR